MNEKRDKLIVECHQLGLGHAEIAADFGITRERVRQIVKRELGASTPLPLTAPARRSKAIAALLAIESGDPVEEAAIESELSDRWLSALLQRSVGLDARQLAFEAWMGQQLGRRFGYWQILSIRPQQQGSLSRARCRATAKCLKCGTVHDVGYRSMEIGASRMCRSCGAKNRRNGVPTIDLQTGVIFPSLLEASRFGGVQYTQLVKPPTSINESLRYRRLTPVRRRARQGKAHRHPVP